MENQKKQNAPLRKGGNNKKYRFSIYWIYGAFLLLFLYLQFTGGGFGGTRSVDTTWYEAAKMIKRGDVSKILVVNQSFAEIYIKADRMYADPEYEELRKKKEAESVKTVSLEEARKNKLDLWS